MENHKHRPKNEFERIIKFEPAFDMRHPDPRRNYGIGDVLIRFVLKGKKGAVQFLFSTGWFLPHVRKELERKNFFTKMTYPRAWHLGYHSPKPISGYEERVEDCPIFEGECYHNGSFIKADPILEKLIAEGEEAVWKELEKYYEEIFVALSQV